MLTDLLEYVYWTDRQSSKLTDATERHTHTTAIAAGTGNYYRYMKMELLDTVEARKLAYYDHTMTKEGNGHEK